MEPSGRVGVHLSFVQFKELPSGVVAAQWNFSSEIYLKTVCVVAFLVSVTGGKFGACQTVAFFFPDFRLMDSMAVLIQVRDAQKRFADQLVLDDAELSLVDDVKVGFIGRNGAGKSTLLKVLLGDEDLEKGEIVHHPSLRIGYLRQHDPFQPGESALDFLMGTAMSPIGVVARWLGNLS